MTSLSELEREVADARARLDGTIDAIQDRLTPAGLLDELMGTIGTTQVRGGFDSALDLAKRNPLPLMIVAAGMGWFIHRLGRDRQRNALVESVSDLPLINTGQSRIYDPDASTRHPGQDSLESRRDLTAHA